MVLQLKEQDKQIISKPEDVAELLRRLLCLEDQLDQDKEHFYCIHLDTRNRIKLIELVSLGILNAALVHPREVFRRAVLEGAAKLLIAHNHPSGQVEPSDADLEITKKLRQAGDILGIPLVDHLIFTQTHHNSLCASTFL